jgi:hypothetical protein
MHYEDLDLMKLFSTAGVLWVGWHARQDAGSQHNESLHPFKTKGTKSTERIRKNTGQEHGTFSGTGLV